MVKNNDTSKIGTHFLAGVQIIEESRKKFSVSSENWTYPKVHFGDPNFDDFYAEIWTDGMDWNQVYWLIAKYEFEVKPYAIPLIFFQDNVVLNRFNTHDFNIMLEAFTYAFKAKVMGIEDKTRWYGDTIWSFLRWDKKEKITFGDQKMISCDYEHASQLPVQFYVNKQIIPKKHLTLVSGPITNGNITIKTDYPNDI